MPEKISCIIGCKDAERDIRECLESVKWADEIIVVDDYSSDRTVEIAREYTDKVYQKKFDGYTQQKEFALAQAACRWVISLDADERVSPQLKEEIQQKLTQPLETTAFYMRRLNFFLGREIKHCGWYEPHCLRVFNKEKARFDTTFKYLGRMRLSGPVGTLQNYLIHYTCRDLEDYLLRVNLWSSLNTDDLIYQGRRITALNSIFCFFVLPPLIFLQKYIFKAGFLDGKVGFFICLLSAATYFISYAKLWEWQKIQAKERESSRLNEI